jgi:beta-glucosidase
MQNRTYRYFSGKPLYGFGYGLSYSKFEYSDLTLLQARSKTSLRVNPSHSVSYLKAGSTMDLDVGVRNTSQVAGDEVVELYLEFPAIPGAPKRALRGFERLHLAAGKIGPVVFALKPRDLSMVNEQGEHVVAPGEYTIFVGGTQPGETSGGVKAKLVITGDEVKLPR